MEELPKYNYIRELYQNEGLSKALEEYYKKPRIHDATFLISRNDTSIQESIHIYNCFQNKILKAKVLSSLIIKYNKNKVQIPKYLINQMIENMKFIILNNKINELNDFKWFCYLNILSLNNRLKEFIDFVISPENKNKKDLEVLISYILNELSKDYRNNELSILILTSIEDLCGMKPNIKHFNCVIKCLMKGYKIRDAKKLLTLMKFNGVEPDEYTYSLLFKGCAVTKQIGLGRQLYERIIQTNQNILNNSFVIDSLLNMFCKCGSLDEAIDYFKMLLSEKINLITTVTWNTLIEGFGMSGRGKEAIDLFDEMIKFGFKPDALTFCGLFIACSESGLVAEAKGIFRAMELKYNVKPEMMHFEKMVDVLCNNSLLSEAEEFIYELDLQRNVDVLKKLYKACVVQGDIERKERVMKRIVEIDPEQESVLQQLR
ncbi:hypothetical protein ABK040_004022 [Willaertia magna]